MKRLIVVVSLMLAVVTIAAAAQSVRFQPAATQGARFYVIGLVKTPGSYVLAGEITVREGIAIAGGLTEDSARLGITIQRRVDGNLSDVAAGMDDAVQPNDTIRVRRRAQ